MRQVILKMSHEDIDNYRLYLLRRIETAKETGNYDVVYRLQRNIRCLRRSIEV